MNVSSFHHFVDYAEGLVLDHFRNAQGKCDPPIDRGRSVTMLSMNEDIADIIDPPMMGRVDVARLVKGPPQVKSPKSPDYSEQTQWMLAIRDDRDKAAFGKLYDHFGPRLKGFVMRGGAPSSQAEDVVQDVMLTIWRKAHLFDPERAQVSSWIYQIARNRQIDVIRKEARPVPEALKAEQPDAEPDAGQVVALEQEAGVLRAAIARLNSTQREMIEKAYIGELSHSEISEATGLPLGTIKSRIRLGLERLRHELKDLRQE